MCLSMSVSAGKWRLLYTSRATTASPIQNTFTGIDAFSVFQEVLLDAGLDGSEETQESFARVNNVVDFGSNIGFLKVMSWMSPVFGCRVQTRSHKGTRGNKGI